MHTEVHWVIKLKDDRSADHEISIKIFDFEAVLETSIPSSLSIIFNIFNQIGAPAALTNGKCYSWKRNSSDHSKIYSCELSEIVSKYEGNIPEALEVLLAFDEENVVQNYDNFSNLSAVNLHYNCSDLRASVVTVDIYLPRPTYILYALSWVRKTILLEKAHKGIYRIYEMQQGGKGQKWDSIKGKSCSPFLRYRSQIDFSGFPHLGFAYEVAGRVPLRILLTSFVLGILSSILSVITSLIANQPWTKKLFDSFVKVITGST